MTETTAAVQKTPMQMAVEAAAAQQAQAQANHQAAAVAQSPAENTAVAMASNPGSSVTTAVSAPKMSMEDAMGSSLSVDCWMKVGYDGIKIGDSPVLIDGEPIHVIITMKDSIGFVIKEAIKGGNPPQYAYTQDRVTATTGGSWAAAMEKIRALPNNANANPYRAVDLPMRVPNDIVVSVLNKTTKQAEDVVVCPAGKIIGHTTSTTNWGAWELLYKAVLAAGLMGKDVAVNVGYTKRTNPKGNEWGTLTFELLGSAEDYLATE